MARSIQAVSADYKLRHSDLEVRVTAGGSTITVTLPPAGGVRKEFDYRVSVASITGGTGTVSVVPSGSETIDGRTSVTLTRLYQTVTFVSDGSNWHVKAHGGLNIRLGSYSAPVPYDGVGLVNAYALDSTADAAASIVGFWLLRSTTVDDAICFEPMIESECTVTGPTSVMVVDALCGLTSASSKLAAAVDHADGMFAGHFKVYCVDGATITSGARAAAVWLDGQMVGVNSLAIVDNYYGIYNTSGGAKYEAFAKLHLISGESAGWRTLFEFNFGTGTDPLVANTAFAAPDTVSPVGGIRVDINGTARYIPFYAAA